MVKKHWVDLEHRIWKKVREIPALDSIILGLSGGADSVALLVVFSSIADALGIKLKACYVHHGSGSNLKYRNEAQEFCQKICLKYQVELIISGPPVNELMSEQSLREFRHSELEKARLQIGAQYIALAQHQDDLFETRLMRLIRGVGSQGLISMCFLDGSLIRPFLDVKKGDLINYLHIKGESFLEDPSNLDLEPFRNWIREHWLPQIEEHSRGSISRFAESLEQISQALYAEKLTVEKQNWSHGCLSRPEYQTWTVAEKKRQIAGVLWASGWRDYSSGQVEEVVKNLDKNQIEYTFTLGPRVWYVDAAQICLRTK